MMPLHRFLVAASLAGSTLAGGGGFARADAVTRDPAREVAAMAARADGAAAELFGPLPVRDMTPFSILRLDMPPAAEIGIARGAWAVEASLAYANTFAMSGNVESYLRARGGRAALSAADADAIVALGGDAFFVDGEYGRLDITVHRALLDHLSLHVTLTAYDFTGGFLDGTIEGFHDQFDLDTSGRELVPRDGFQAVYAIGGVQGAYLDAPVATGIGDPVVGLRTAWPLGGSRWRMVLDGAVKIAWRGERLFLSTGSNDYGLSASLQGRFRRQAVYLGAGVVDTNGRVLNIEQERHAVASGSIGYEVAVRGGASLIVQLNAARSTISDAALEELGADKFQLSLGLRSRYGPVVYGFSLTENVFNFDNTPDFGVALSIGWIERAAPGEGTDA